MPALPDSNLHLDILMGRDETIVPADIFGGELYISSLLQLCIHALCSGMEDAPPQNIHRDMEKKLKM
jgi:proteasome maturation protein